MKKEIPNKFEYGEKYWELMKELNTKTAELINTVRICLDYGAGLNLLKDYAPENVIVDSFDIGDFPIKYTGIRHKKYDLIFLCDVLEHIPDFGVLDEVFKISEYVFVSVPILPKGRKLKGWRHFKYDTKEHIHYFIKESLDLFFEARGFGKIKEGYPEVECGIREDIYTVLFKKKGD